MDNSELLILRALRLKGRANGEALASATGLSEDQATTIASDLVSSGEAREMRDNFMLMPSGRERLTALLDQERAGLDGQAVEEVYAQFTAVNGDFKQLAADWQMRGGELNDHTDSGYDQTVMDRLPGIHRRVSPVLDRLASIAPRLEPYQSRLQSALEKVQGGDTTWLLKPLIDSYHTVWFELHEELIGLAGRTREAEAAGGRAE